MGLSSQSGREEIKHKDNITSCTLITLHPQRTLYWIFLVFEMSNVYLLKFILKLEFNFVFRLHSKLEILVSFQIMCILSMYAKAKAKIALKNI